MSGYVDGVGDEVRFAFLVHDIEVSADGTTVYLADRSNRVIRALDPATRTVTTVAGAAYTGAVQHADGVGAAVRMSGLGGMARVGDLIYFADTFNHCIRRFDPATGEVVTIAGNPAVRGNADGIGAAASFDVPQQLSTDGENLYVMGFNGTIRRVRLSDFRVDTILGDPEDLRAVDGVGAEVRFGVSFGPSPIDPAARVLYFNDRSANSFRAVALDTLTVRTIAGAVEPRGARDGAFSSARFASPAAIVCTADGSRCYISDSGNHTIRVLDRERREVRTLAGAAGVPDVDDGAFADARFADPRGLALDEAAGRLFVADNANHTLRVLDLAMGTVSTLAGEPERSGFEDGVGSDALFDGPLGLALTPDGSTLYVSEFGNRTLRRVDVATGAVTLLAGAAGSAGDADGTGASARFRRPGAMVVSSDGETLYVGDRDVNGNVVRAVRLTTGAVTTLVGVANQAGVADGTFEEARLSGPWGLAFSPAGHLLVAELRNGVVRRIDLDAERVSVWLGDPERRGNLPYGLRVPIADAILNSPAAIAVAGEDLVLLSEDAVLVARPEGTW
jgi:DNA-binding beta-propeller fold protein YncE